MFGKDYLFAHNGSLKEYKKLSLKRFSPIGETDSEYIFCYIMDLIEKRNIEKWREKDFHWLLSEFRKINNYGNFNCMLSDGEHLFCYFDKNEFNGLHFVKREINLVKQKNSTQYGYIIATKPLTNENWQKFKASELIVFKNGDIIYGVGDLSALYAVLMPGGVKNLKKNKYFIFEK